MVFLPAETIHAVYFIIIIVLADEQECCFCGFSSFVTNLVWKLSHKQ